MNSNISLPLVSILIPVYNHSKYVVECLNSIVQQDYSNIEILLLDDGSKDNSYEIVLLWIKSNPEIKVSITKQTNQGVCRTLNTLVNQAKGEFITLCASDDEITKAGISERVTALMAAPEKMAVIGDAILIDQDSNEVSVSSMKSLFKASNTKLRKNIVNELVFRWSVVGPTLLIRRAAYKSLGLYDEGLVVEDREFYLRLLAKDQLTFVPSPVACYRVHTDNASRKSIAAKLVVYEQVAVSNLKHASKFEGLKYLFLKSYLVDALILRQGKNIITYWVLFPYRALRYLLFVKLR